MSNNKRILIMTLFSIILSGCSINLTKQEQQLLDFVNADTQLKNTIENYASELTGIPFTISKVIYPKMKTYMTDRMNVHLVTTKDPNLSLIMRIDIKNKEAIHKIYNNDFQDLIRLESEQDLERVYLKLLNKRYETVYGHVYGSISKFNDAIEIRDSNDYLYPSLEVGRFSSDLINQLTTEYSESNFLEPRQDTIDYWKKRFTSTLIRTEPLIAGDTVITKASQIRIKLSFDSKRLTENQAIDTVKKWVENSIGIIPDKITHVIELLPKNASMNQYKTITFKIQDGFVIYE